MCVYIIFMCIYIDIHICMYIYIYLQDIYTHRAYRVNINKNLHFFLFAWRDARAHTHRTTHIHTDVCVGIYKHQWDCRTLLSN